MRSPGGTQAEDTRRQLVRALIAEGVPVAIAEREAGLIVEAVSHG